MLEEAIGDVIDDDVVLVGGVITKVDEVEVLIFDWSAGDGWICASLILLNATCFCLFFFLWVSCWVLFFLLISIN